MTSTDDITATLESALQRIDPFLRFLTKATGKASVPLKSLESVLPKNNNIDDTVNKKNEIQGLLTELSIRGVLNYNTKDETVGFPLPPSSSADEDNNGMASSSSSPLFQPPSKMIGKGLHGSSDAAAKRRMRVLKFTLKQNKVWVSHQSQMNGSNTDHKEIGSDLSSPKQNAATTEKMKPAKQPTAAAAEECTKEDNRTTDCILDFNNTEADNNCEERKSAYQSLGDLLTGKDDKTKSINNADNDDKTSPRIWLPSQPAHAGSHPSRPARYGYLTDSTVAKIPDSVSQLFGFYLSSKGEKADDTTNSTTVETTTTQHKRLFQHQADAIESAMDGIHTCLCTGTGSGKSLCFLLPLMARAVTSITNDTTTAILIFPTKALAQDQYSKIATMLSNSNCNVRAGVIDGDTPYQQRDVIASECQIVLTNPDTLHANILPGWKRSSYKSFLSRLRTVVVDEAHIYEGVFGAHVSLVLRRLKRVCRAASENKTNNGLSFIACSATLTRPEDHFRMLCPLGNEEVCIVTEDGSPCGAKHFFVWNPPILDVNGNSTDSVFPPKNLSAGQIEQIAIVGDDNDECVINVGTKKRRKKGKTGKASGNNNGMPTTQFSNLFIRRRHAADETAFLLAKAICAQTRTIAFAGTRCLVEWIYDKTLSILKSNPDTADLAPLVESYRGGYTAETRRSIESKLFRKELLAVVGTNALELGVDIGGVDLTLHCGYPGSKNSLLQQSGRAGRGKGHMKPSCAIMITFSAASDQFVWRKPASLLSRGIDAPPTSISETVMSGHILCAADEFPLTGSLPLTCLLNESTNDNTFISDETLMGEGYQNAVDFLSQKGLLSKKKVKAIQSGNVETKIVLKTHPIVKSPWTRVSLRSIEPLNYSIVDLSHPMQANRTDKVHDKSAVLDVIPYSRVFYHAFPGAVIKHRGRKYRIEAMESPPSFVGGQSFGSTNLVAFAKPTNVQYTTQALSINEITVVKQTRHAELNDSKAQQSVAGSGLVTVKRSVHGYKVLSHVNRKEISRTTLNLPPMEYDTYAIWIDADAANLNGLVSNFNEGVHALNHAMVAVAPLILSCSSSDIDCDHSTYECTRVLLFGRYLVSFQLEF